MRRAALLVGLLIGAWAWLVPGVPAAPLHAQDPEPVATLEAGDFRALAVSPDGGRLFVADAATNSLRVFNFENPAMPELINNAALEGVPLDTAAVGDLAFVIVDTGRESDLLHVITQIPYGRRQFDTVNLLDIPSDARAVRASADGRWAIVLGEAQYTVLEIISAFEINLTTIEAPPVIDAAISGDTLMLAIRDEARIETSQLLPGVSLVSDAEITLGAPPLAIALSSSGRLLGALLNNQTVDVIDLGRGTTISRLTPRDAGANRLVFLTPTAGERLATARESSAQVDLFDYRTLTSRPVLRVLSLTTPARAIAAYGDLLVITDGMIVSIYNTRR